MIGRYRWRRFAARGLSLVVAVAASTSAGASWREVYQADSQFDIAAARNFALAAITDNPSGPDALAAAGWWLENLSSVTEPREILEVTGDEPVAPELAFLLARVEGNLGNRPPEGSLATVEIAGPYGRFDVLDL